MTRVTTNQLVRCVNYRVARGRRVGVLAFQRYGQTIVSDGPVDAQLSTRLRSGDLLSYRRRDGVYVVACVGSMRTPRDEADDSIDNAARRIGRTLHDLAGGPFAAVWQRFIRPTSVSELGGVLQSQLVVQIERHRMLARIAHELRSPLCSIRGYLELLEDCNAAASDGRAYVHTARAETLRLGRMLDGMTEFSLLDGGAANESISCDVGAGVARAILAVRPTAIRRGVTVLAIKQTRHPACVKADDCVRAATNVLENAVNAGAHRVLVSSTYRNGFVAVTFDDDGPGVPASERRAIFACGYRGSAGANYTGSGFGLASVRTIAESSGGSVRVAPSALGGARFSLRFGAIPYPAERPV